MGVTRYFTTVIGYKIDTNLIYNADRKFIDYHKTCQNFDKSFKHCPDCGIKTDLEKDVYVMTYTNGFNVNNSNDSNNSLDGKLQFYDYPVYDLDVEFENIGSSKEFDYSIIVLYHHMQSYEHEEVTQMNFDLEQIYERKKKLDELLKLNNLPTTNFGFFTIAMNS